MRSGARASRLPLSLRSPGRRPASAQTPEQFYKGKSIDMIIGYPPAGSNDVYARLVARHLGKHIPGNPSIVPKNMPGAGSFLALAHVYNIAAKDGTVDRHRRADLGARRKARHPGRALQDRRAELDRPRRLAREHGVPLAHLAGEDLRRRAENGIETVRHRRRLHRVGLSARHQQRARHQVQADHGLQGLRRSAARGRARRGRRALDVVDRGEGRPSRLVPDQEDFDHRAVRAQAASRAAGGADRGRAGAQRRGARHPQRGDERHRSRHRVL